MEAPNRIYFFPIDATGKETGEAIPVEVGADGVADISKLPDAIRNTVMVGVLDRFGENMITPKDGASFLSALLRMTNGYIRFRREATPAA